MGNGNEYQQCVGDGSQSGTFGSERKMTILKWSLFLSLMQILNSCVPFRFQAMYGARAQTALPFAMNSEFSRVLSTQMVRFGLCRMNIINNQKL